MGYNTDFYGQFKLDKPLTAAQVTKLKEFAEERHEGNHPGYYCQWVPTDDGAAIVWDEGEKFYDYIEWIQYLIAHFIQPWGYKLNGSVRWNGEEHDDTGVILVTDNMVRSATDLRTNELE